MQKDRSDAGPIPLDDALRRMVSAPPPPKKPKAPKKPRKDKEPPK